MNIGLLFSGVFCYLALPLTILSQDLSEALSPKKSFDAFVGLENTGLYQGICYAAKYRLITKNAPYFEDSTSFSGAVKYDGQYYSNLSLKYDVFADKVLLHLDTQVGEISTLELLNPYLTRFSLGSREFVNLRPKQNPGLKRHGFYEEKYQGDTLAFLIKHQKKKFDRKNNRFVYQEFLEAKSLHLLYWNGRYLPIDTKKELIAVFPDFESEINQLYSQLKRLRLRKRDDFKAVMINRLDQLLFELKNASKP